jgi:hypothetical protein
MNQTNTHNVNKTRDLLQTSGGKDERNIKEVSCLVYVICVCLVHLYLQLFVRGLMSCLRCLCLFGPSLPPDVCKALHHPNKNYTQRKQDTRPLTNIWR